MVCVRTTQYWFSASKVGKQKSNCTWKIEIFLEIVLLSIQQVWRIQQQMYANHYEIKWNLIHLPLFRFRRNHLMKSPSPRCVPWKKPNTKLTFRISQKMTEESKSGMKYPVAIEFRIVFNSILRGDCHKLWMKVTCQSNIFHGNACYSINRNVQQGDNLLRHAISASWKGIVLPMTYWFHSRRKSTSRGLSLTTCFSANDCTDVAAVSVPKLHSSPLGNSSQR